MFGSTDDFDEGTVSLSPFFRDGNIFRPLQILAGQGLRAGHDVGCRPLGDDSAAVFPRFRADIDDVVGWPKPSTARPTGRGNSRPSKGSNTSIRSSTSTSRLSAGRRGPTRRRTPASSMLSASSTARRRKPRSEAIKPAASASTSRAAAVKPVPVMVF